MSLEEIIQSHFTEVEKRTFPHPPNYIVSRSQNWLSMAGAVYYHPRPSDSRCGRLPVVFFFTVFLDR